MLPTDDGELIMQRKAALALHALPADVRRRVWSRLDLAKQEMLSPLLEELEALGIPKGRHWLDEVPGGEPALQAVDHGLPPSDHALVWRLNADCALALLSQQPLDTALMVMRMEAWPWLHAVVQNWAPHQRHLVRAQIEVAMPVPPMLARALLKCMASSARSRVNNAASMAVQPAPKGRWYRGVTSLFALI